MQLFLKLSGWIGGPAILGVIVGRYLDQKFHTAPWLLILSSAIAFIASMSALLYIAKKEMGRIDKEMQNKNK